MVRRTEPGTTAARRQAATGDLGVRILGAILCLGVVAIHVIDQHGFPGTESPQYVNILFYILEVAGVLTAVLLLAGWRLVGWFLALGVAAGPILGFILSRGPGLPDYTDDIGNWAEPRGVASLVVEGILLVLAVTMLAMPSQAGRPGSGRPTAL